MSPKELPYEAVCRLVGRLFLETQFQLEQLREQAGKSILDLQQKLAHEQQRRADAEARCNGPSAT